MTILETAKALGTALAESAEFRRVQFADAAMQLDEDARRTLDEYEAERREIGAATRDAQIDREGLNACRLRLSACVEQAMANETVKEYLEAHQAFNNLMGQVNGLLSFALKGGEDCGGSCGGCGGCGART
jgi:cell fate (sporulation/competence/biofilm development) regulator YlbF (YheA/YmcA/DUF963 family)